MITLINTGRAGVAYDEHGHTVGGGERVEVEQINPVAQAAVDVGQLRCEDDDQDTPDDAGTPGASQPE